MKHHISKACLFIFLMITLFSGCEIQEDFEYQKSDASGQFDISAWEFIQNNESLNMLEEAILLTNLSIKYQDESARTYIAPSNAAFLEYLEMNEYESLVEVPLPILRNVLEYHIVNDQVLFTDPKLFDSNTPISYKTENGQIMYLSHNTNFIGLVNQGTAKQWEIKVSNLQPQDDVIHIVDDVVYFSANSGSLDIADPTIERDTIISIQDTYINGGSNAAVNYGSDVIMKVKNVTGDGDFDRKAYMMFDLNDLKKEGVITDLKLEMAVKFTAAKGVGMNLYSIQDTSWTELGLTFENATFPEGEPIASLTTTKISQFDFDLTEFFNNLGGKQKIALVLDGEAGTDETDEFASKENVDFASPTIIATLASGNSSLELISNNGFSLQKAGSFVLNTETIEITGAAPNDIIYILEEAPQHGWLISGASILKAGDRFTQNDIDLMNLVYINDGTGTMDTIILSAKDRAGASLEPFSVIITLQ